MKFPIACCLLKLTPFNLSLRKYAQSLTSAGVRSLRSNRAFLYPSGADLLGGITQFYFTPSALRASPPNADSKILIDDKKSHVAFGGGRRGSLLPRRLEHFLDALAILACMLIHSR